MERIGSVTGVRVLAWKVPVEDFLGICGFRL